MKLFTILMFSLVLTGCCADDSLFGAAPNACDGSLQAAPPCQMMAAAPMSPCGEPPEEANPGEVWCCVPVQLAAAAPERICTKPECCRTVHVPAQWEEVTERVLVEAERTEWQQVDCADQDDPNRICYRKTVIPARYEERARRRLLRDAYNTIEYIPAEYEMLAGAAPAPVYRWQRFKECEIPENAVNVFDPNANDFEDALAPPAGAAPIR